MVAKANCIIQKCINDFIIQIATDNIELYNEAGLQHELAIYLRVNIGEKFNIKLERNIFALNLVKSDFVKKEIDLYIEEKANSLKKYAIELKLIHGRAVPKRMFQAFEDVLFLEQLKKNGFKNGYLLFATPKRSFWNSNLADWNMYKCFQGTNIVFENLSNNCVPPFLRKESPNLLIQYTSKYSAEWKELITQNNVQWRCFLVKG